MIEFNRINKKCAKLAKKIGFNEKCNYAWSDKDEILGDYARYYDFNNDDEVKNHGRFPLYSAPTLFELKKWFSINYNLDVDALPTEYGYVYKIMSSYLKHKYSLSGKLINVSTFLYESYDDALSEGLFYALKYIKKIKRQKL